MAQDPILAIAFDRHMHTRLAVRGKPLTGYQPSESLLLADVPVEDFAVTGQQPISPVADPRHGSGHQWVTTGRHADGLEKEVSRHLLRRPARLRRAADPLPQHGQRRHSRSPAGATPRMNWLTRQAASGAFPAPPTPIAATGCSRWAPNFDQRNSLAMDSSDYGGGTPVANIWRHDVGLAVGHVEPVVRGLDLPVRKTATGAQIAVESAKASTLAAGQTLVTERTLLAVHTGDHFAPLKQYRQYMQAEGLVAPRAPDSAFAPVWCAWGYERNFTVKQVMDTVPKARELGFEWVVLDDGWQTNEGDWRVDTTKFPRGDADMRAFTAHVRSQGMRPRLWLAPLAADPGSDVLHDHVDMLLLDKDGAFQKVTWWNALTQCPAYQPTIDYYVAMVKKIIGDWGFDGIKFDGQHLNAVAPCYNPAHKHAHPSDSVAGAGHVLGRAAPGDARNQSAGGDGAVPVRHHVRLPQPSRDRPVPGVRSDLVLAGAQQGQVDEGADGLTQQLCGRPRGAVRRRRRFRLDASASAPWCHRSSPGRGIPTHPTDVLPPGGFVLTAGEGSAVAQVGRSLQAAHAAQGRIPGLALRHRFRQTRDARHRQGRCDVLRLLRR